jgi:hypothetical protein
MAYAVLHNDDVTNGFWFEWPNQYNAFMVCLQQIVEKKKEKGRVQTVMASSAPTRMPRTTYASAGVNHDFQHVALISSLTSATSPEEGMISWYKELNKCS